MSAWQRDGMSWTVDGLTPDEFVSFSLDDYLPRGSKVTGVKLTYVTGGSYVEGDAVLELVTHDSAGDQTTQVMNSLALPATLAATRKVALAISTRLLMSDGKETLIRVRCMAERAAQVTVHGTNVTYTYTNRPQPYPLTRLVALAGALALLPSTNTRAPDWNTLYEVDLSDQPNQSAGAAGSYAIDGNTWWLKGALSGLAGGQTVTASVVNGQGLTLSFGVATATGLGTSGALPQATWWLPFSQFADFNPNAPYLVQWRPRYILPAGGVIAAGGVSSLADSAAEVAAAERQYESLGGTLRFNGGTTSANFKHGTGAVASESVGFLYDNFSGQLQCALLCAPWLSVYQNAFWSGSFAARDAMTLKPSANIDQPARATPGFMFAADTNGGSAPQGGYITHLKIMQPKFV